ncbi:hypothetical protein ACH4FE_35350 [Streptomyces celluloflavus]|uniref:hypothetical protein n=1 Tax=Streptomyces celluloflavus TaxID=58344 RepID=UPI0037905DE0
MEFSTGEGTASYGKFEEDAPPEAVMTEAAPVVSPVPEDDLEQTPSRRLSPGA